jgi:arsenate reductase
MMKNLLFVCVENRARSQMAEGLAKHFLGADYEIFSAGSHPADRVHPTAVAAMAEIGIHIHDQKPKSFADVDMSRIDTVITLCAEEECPILPPHVRHLNWSLPDPGSGPTEHPEDVLRKFRKTRDEIRKRILDLRSENQMW